LTQLSIIIVNYRSADLIINCLNSIHKYSTINPEIIIVDNDSGDDSKERIMNVHSGIEWIQMGYNAGFARANNAGIKLAKGELILLLNPDTLFFDNALDKCCRLFAESNAVACGVQLLNENGSSQISGNYAMTGGLNYLLPLPYLGNTLKALATFIQVKKPNVPEAMDTIEVDWINGAFLMVKKSVLEIAGLMDEDFFLYAEEAEWCSRLKKQGSVVIFGECRIIHLQGETANETFESDGKGYFNLFDKKGLQIMVSNFLRIRKEFGVGWFLFDLFFYTLAIPFFFVGLCIESVLFPGKKNYQFRQVGAFAKNVIMLIGLSGKIIRGKPYFYKML
jgi:GT2 family glycosyltransferase